MIRFSPLFTTGNLPGSQMSAQGTTPFSVGFVDGPGAKKFAGKQTDFMTLVPTDADTLGVRPDLAGRPITQLGRHYGSAFKGKLPF